jgi:hypothetical protein
MLLAGARACWGTYLLLAGCFCNLLLLAGAGRQGVFCTIRECARGWGAGGRDLEAENVCRGRWVSSEWIFGLVRESNKKTERPPALSSCLLASVFFLWLSESKREPI